MSSKPQSSLGLLAILLGSLKTTIKNGKVVVWHLLFVFLQFGLLMLAVHLLLTPILADIALKKTDLLEKNATYEEDRRIEIGIIKDFGLLILLQLIVLVYTCALLLFFSISIIHSTYEAYNGKGLSLKEAVVSFRGRWRRPLKTSACMTLILLALVILFMAAVSVLPATTGGLPFISLNVLVAILGFLSYVYLYSLWMLALVISVLEDDYSGLMAVERASELMKGKKVQACALTLLLTMAGGFVYVASFVMMRETEGLAWAELAISAGKIWLACVVKLATFVVYTVFYHECKKSHPEDEMVGGLIGYHPISSTEV